MIATKRGKWAAAATQRCDENVYIAAARRHCSCKLKGSPARVDIRTVQCCSAGQCPAHVANAANTAVFTRRVWNNENKRLSSTLAFYEIVLRS
jgi:hypothetical protein